MDMNNQYGNGYVVLPIEEYNKLLRESDSFANMCESAVKEISDDRSWRDGIRDVKAVLDTKFVERIIITSGKLNAEQLEKYEDKSKYDLTIDLYSYKVEEPKEEVSEE